MYNIPKDDIIKILDNKEKDAKNVFKSQTNLFDSVKPLI